MTTSPLSVGTDYETLANRFRPLFRQIAAGNVEREQGRDLPRESIQILKQAGFGAVRVPVEYGGEPIDIGFNPQFMVDALRVIRTPQFEMELGQSDRPGLIKSGNDFLYVLMPINLS